MFGKRGIPIIRELTIRIGRIIESKHIVRAALGAPDLLTNIGRFTFELLRIDAHFGEHIGQRRIDALLVREPGAR